MNMIMSWGEIFKPASKASKLARPKVGEILLAYIMPFSLLMPVMMALALQAPNIFNKALLSEHIYIIGLLLFVLQMVSLPLMAWAAKSLADMVMVKASFRDSLLIMAISATPYWLVSLFYLVPSLQFNLMMYGVATVLASVLVYFGVKNILGVQARGARAILTGAILATASMVIGVVFIGSLIFWEYIQHSSLILNNKVTIVSLKH